MHPAPTTGVEGGGSSGQLPVGAAAARPPAPGEAPAPAAAPAPVPLPPAAVAALPAPSAPDGACAGAAAAVATPCAAPATQAVQQHDAAELQSQAAGVASEQLLFILTTSPAPRTVDAVRAAAERRDEVRVQHDGVTVPVPLGAVAALRGAAGGLAHARFLWEEFGAVRVLLSDEWPLGALRSGCSVAGGKGCDLVVEAMRGGVARLLDDTVIAHEAKTGAPREGEDFKLHCKGDSLWQLGGVLRAARSVVAGDAAAELQGSAPLALLTRAAVDADVDAAAEWGDISAQVDAVLVPADALVDAITTALGSPEAKTELDNWRWRAWALRNVPALLAWGRCRGMLPDAPASMRARWLRVAAPPPPPAPPALAPAALAAAAPPPPPAPAAPAAPPAAADAVAPPRQRRRHGGGHFERPDKKAFVRAVELLRYDALDGTQHDSLARRSEEDGAVRPSGLLKLADVAALWYSRGSNDLSFDLLIPAGITPRETNETCPLL